MRRLLLCLLAAGTLWNGSTDQVFQDKDVVGFWGDSITHAAYSEINYTHVLYNYYVTHFPEREMEFRNLGVEGSRLSHGLDLYEKDPSAQGLTKVVLEYGINDLKEYLYEDPELYADSGEAREEGLQEFENNLETFLSLLQESGIESDHVFAATLPIPRNLSPEESSDMELAQTRLQEGYEEMSDVVREFAAKNGTELLELRAPLSDLWESLYAQSQDPEKNIMEDDGLHIDTAGQIYLAYLFLEQQGALQDVSNVKIDDGSIRAENAEVSNLHYEDGYLYYDYRAYSLPMGISHEYFEADEILHILDKMNREIIQVEGLEGESLYDIYISGEKIGSYSGAEFADGVNIANIQENSSQMYARAVEQMNRGRRVSELEYRKVVENLTDCGSGETTEEELQEAYQTWSEEDAQYRQGMYELVRERLQDTERIAIVRQGAQAPDAAFKVPGNGWKKAAAAIGLVSGTILTAAAGYFVFKRKLL